MYIVVLIDRGLLNNLMFYYVFRRVLSGDPTVLVLLPSKNKLYFTRNSYKPHLAIVAIMDS